MIKITELYDELDKMENAKDIIKRLDMPAYCNCSAQIDKEVMEQVNKLFGKYLKSSTRVVLNSKIDKEYTYAKRKSELLISKIGVGVKNEWQSINSPYKSFLHTGYGSNTFGSFKTAILDNKENYDKLNNVLNDYGKDILKKVKDCVDKYNIVLSNINDYSFTHALNSKEKKIFNSSGPLVISLKETPTTPFILIKNIPGVYSGTDFGKGFYLYDGNILQYMALNECSDEVNKLIDKYIAGTKKQYDNWVAFKEELMGELAKYLILSKI